MPFDPYVPSLSLDQQQQIHITIPQSDALINDQGYTYNQAGFSYNQAGVDYGGIYNETEDIVPALVFVKDSIASMVVDNTDAIFTDQGYHYNQAGFTYNQAGVDYAGVSNPTEDILEMVLSTDFTTPHSYGIFDQGSNQPLPPTPAPNRGPGFFLYVNLN